MKYPNLFSTGKIGKLELNNRTIMTAMGAGMANKDGSPSEQMIAYYTERAKGGVGLIITEVTRINDIHGAAEPNQISASNDALIPELAKLAASIHQYQTKIFLQLHHPGREAPGFLEKDGITVAPSAVMCKTMGAMPRALDYEEILELIQQFIDGAVRAKAAGFDGVELHAGHGYLLGQFMSTYSNRRTDAYGGSFENRGRIVVEIIQGIKKACGEDFPISVRISADEFLGFEGIQLPQGVAFAKMFEAAGADAINVSSGLYETSETTIEPSSFEEGWRVYLSDAVKKEVSVPVFGNSVIRTPKYAEQLLADGRVDFISMGRPFLADPYWAEKVRSGREAEIAECIGCLRCIEKLLTFQGPIECSMNPRLGREAEISEELPKDGKGRTVVVVGAGPAGLSAARTLALRDFKPVILEARDVIGGQVNFAMLPPSKGHLGNLMKYMNEEIDRLGIEVRYNTNADAELLDELNPYAIIIATGSEDVIPRAIPGVDLSHVYTDEDVLSGKVILENKRIVIIGSGLRGIETADYLAERGNAISVVEMQGIICPEGYRLAVKDVLNNLTKFNPKLMTNHKLLEIKQDRVILEGDITEVACDAVILALGVRSRNELYNELKSKNLNVFNAGDSVQPGRIVKAVRDGFDIAMGIQ